MSESNSNGKRDSKATDPRKSRLFMAVRKAEGDLEEPLPPSGLRVRIAKSFSSLMGVKLEKSQRSTVPRFIYEQVPTVLEPPHDQIGLFDLFMRGWVTRQILRAIRQEVLGAGVDEDPWGNEPRFVKKCTGCGKEFEAAADVCDKCEAAKKPYELRDPDEGEHQIVESLIRRPNPEYNFFSLLSSTIGYLLSLDDFYWSVFYGTEAKMDGETLSLERKPREVYVEDSRFIRPVADSYGHLGNDEYFCPTCYDPSNDSPKVKLDLESVKRGETPKCPQCGGPVIQTCWVQMIGGQIKARLGREEMVHGSGERILPDLFGNPKMLALVKLASMLNAMDEYNLGVYSEGKVGSFLIFPGMEQDQIDSMLQKAQRALEEREKQDLQTGKLIAKKKVRTICLGVKEPVTRLPVMEDFERMQSLDFYKLAVEKVCATYGVTPVFVSIIESGKSGNNPRMQIDVQDHTTREIRRLLESVVNEQLFPLYGIHDWVWRFGAIEQRDDLRMAQIDLVKAQTAGAYRAAGFKVSRNEDGELEVSAEAAEAPPQGAGAQPPQGVSPGSPAVPLPTVSEPSGDLLQSDKKDLARLPVSWFEVSKLEYNQHVYALNNDKDSVTLTVDNVRSEGDWTTLQLGDALAALLDRLFITVKEQLSSNEGFNRTEFESYSNSVVTSYRRSLDDGRNVLTGFCSELDNMGLKPLAEVLDDWRERVSKLKPSTLEEVS